MLFTGFSVYCKTLALLPIRIERNYFCVQAHDIWSCLFSAEPPSFTEAPKPVVRAAEVQDISLKCRTFGAPKPVITWTKDGEAITDNRFKVKKNGDLKIKVGCEL